MCLEWRVGACKIKFPQNIHKREGKMKFLDKYANLSSKHY